MISPLDASSIHLGGIGQRDAPRQRHVPQLTQGLMRRVVDRGIPGLPSQMPKPSPNEHPGNANFYFVGGLHRIDIPVLSYYSQLLMLDTPIVGSNIQYWWLLAPQGGSL